MGEERGEDEEDEGPFGCDPDLQRGIGSATVGNTDQGADGSYEEQLIAVWNIAFWNLRF